MNIPKTKQVVAVFDVLCKDDGSWTKEDIALHLDTCTATDTWENAIVWDSVHDFLADLKSGHITVEN